MFFNCQILEQSMLVIPYVIVLIVFTHSIIPWDFCLYDFLRLFNDLLPFLYCRKHLKMQIHQSFNSDVLYFFIWWVLGFLCDPSYLVFLWEGVIAPKFAISLTIKNATTPIDVVAIPTSIATTSPHCMKYCLTFRSFLLLSPCVFLLLWCHWIIQSNFHDFVLCKEELKTKNWKVDKKETK